jgi:hypothetical protein
MTDAESPLVIRLPGNPTEVDCWEQSPLYREIAKRLAARDLPWTEVLGLLGDAHEADGQALALAAGGGGVEHQGDEAEVAHAGMDAATAVPGSAAAGPPAMKLT